MAIGSMTTNSTVDMIDKTLKTENAPADAAAVGDIILDRTKETPQPIFYSKAEVDAKIKEILAAQREEDYAKIKFWVSPDPTSPASLFGGTWERIKDRFILAAGDTYAAGSAGGEAEHTLTVKEMPSHNHNLAKYYKISDAPGEGLVQAYGNTAYQGENDITPGYYYVSVTTSSGDSKPHNNLPPYLTAYIWRRIA